MARGSQCSLSLGGRNSALPAGGVIGSLGVPGACPSGKRRNGADRLPSIPNYIPRGGAGALSEGPAWGGGFLGFRFDDKLFC